MSGKKKRRRFSDEFKAEVVRQVQTSGRPASEIARELGINVNLLYRWRGAVEAETPREELAMAEELGRLRKENARLRREKEILEKATAIFAEYRR